MATENNGFCTEPPRMKRLTYTDCVIVYHMCWNAMGSEKRTSLIKGFSLSVKQLHITKGIRLTQY